MLNEESNGETGSRNARVAMFGYASDARDQAIRLRALGCRVSVVVRPGGMSWIRAVEDGFRPVVPREAVTHASIVCLYVPEAEQPSVWAFGIAPYVSAGSLVVFARGSALYLGAIEPDPALDVVLVTRAGERAGGCRIAVTHNGSGHALERAAAFARDVCGAARVGTTTLESEVRAELTALVDKVGASALLAEWDRVLANSGHEPDEATLGYYERLRGFVFDVRVGTLAKPPASGIELVGQVRTPRKRGAA